MNQLIQNQEGWAWPSKSRKAHYFIAGISLCGAWGYYGPFPEMPIDESSKCRSCGNQVTKRLIYAEAFR